MASTEVGLKPPWNQPQADAAGVEQVTDVLARELDAVRVGAVVELGLRVADDRAVLDAAEPLGTSVPWVWPETRLIAPTVDGPKFVPNELSLIAKFWARFHRPVTVLPS